MTTPAETQIERNRLLSELCRMLELMCLHLRDATPASKEHMELEFRMMTDVVGVNHTNLAMIRSLIASMESMTKTDPTHWKKVFDAAFYTIYNNSTRRRIYYHSEKKADGTIPTTHETVIKTPVMDNGEEMQFFVSCANRPTNFRVTLSKERMIDHDPAVKQHDAMSVHQRRSFEHCIRGEFGHPSAVVVRYDITKVSKRGADKKDIMGEARYHVEMELVSLPKWIDDPEARAAQNREVAKLLFQYFCTLMGPHDENGHLLPPPDLSIVSVK